MTKEEILKLLVDADYEQEYAEKFAAYCMRLKLDKSKDGKLKNPWMQSRTAAQMVDLYKRVNRDGLVFDGEHITLQSTGISYDYIAYKNKMLLSYPESQVDVSLVYKDDEFAFKKENGEVKYSHKIANPFGQKAEEIQGGYCVIKNKRGEFITLLSADDINKHRKVAKTDYIWREWMKEMALKTVIKKACKQHFADIYQGIEESDNENYNLDNPIGLDLKYKQEMDAIKTIDELRAYYQKNKGKGADFDKYCAIRKNQLTQPK